MGYETTLLIGTDTGQTFEDYTYFLVYAAIDMGKMSHSHLLLLPRANHTPEVQKWEFFPMAGDGDEATREDRYGELPQPIPIEAVIRALQKDVDKDKYRPAERALAMAKSFIDTKTPNETISVILYGH